MKAFCSWKGSARLRLRTKQRSTPASLTRYISSAAHFTKAEHLLFWQYLERKSRAPKPLVAQRPPRPCLTPFYTYAKSTPKWAPLQIEDHYGMESGSVLTTISWNIDAFSPDANARVTAILDYLQDVCEGSPTKTVIMFQEVCQESLNAILESQWVQRHFKLSDVAPPQSIRADIFGDCFVMKRLDWEASKYFSLVMISTDLPVLNGFRVPFVTKMGRDALAVNVLLRGSSGSSKKQDVVRLCTTHLESLYSGRCYRPGQLALTSTLLKDDLRMNQNLVAGLVAGDMNAIDKSEHEYTKARDVQLQDAWENGPEETIPILKPFQRDITNGQARGDTWGYQRRSGKRGGKRMDKILYTGSLEYIPLKGGEQLTRGMRRLGVGLKTVVEACRYETSTSPITRRGKITPTTETRFCSQEQMERFRQLPNSFLKNAVQTSTAAWVSDHYGILAKFRVIASRPG